jgi:fatty acid desaturase
VPPYFFRYFHLGHHRYTQVPGKDPSLVLPEPATFPQYLWYCAALWFWWRNLSWIIRHAAGRVDSASNTYVPKARLHLMVLEARIMLVVYCVLALLASSSGYGWTLLLCWLLPRFLGEPIQRILRVAEHVGCEESPDLLKNTRTTLSNWIVHFLAWQMPYHAEHHLYPNVPFYRLSAVHRVVAERVIVEPDGYLCGQRRIIRRLRQRPSANHKGSFGTPVL